VFTEPLPSNDRRDTDTWEGFMKYAIEMGLGAMKYIPIFIKISSGIQEVDWGGGRFTDTQTAWKCQKPSFTFSQLSLF
jgi:hypothetical protein